MRRPEAHADRSLRNAGRGTHLVPTWQQPVQCPMFAQAAVHGKLELATRAMAESESGPALSLAYLRAGPFISGTSHALLLLGQRPKDWNDASAEGQVSEGGNDQARKEKTERSQQGKRGRGTITLRDLVDGGILSPGRSNMSVTYKGITYTAGLQRDGLIQWQDKKFNSATAFSIHVKRLQTPNKQGDDGWKSVLYEGTQLDNFRRKFQATAKPATAPEEEVEEEVEPAAEREDGATASASTDQWVQCDRCRTWRVVPPEHWPAVEADEREEWLCEFAAWDVAKYQPFKPSCAS